jgi:DNA-binding winged helix-turn-helix (wHTH) protein
MGSIYYGKFARARTYRLSLPVLDMMKSTAWLDSNLVPMIMWRSRWALRELLARIRAVMCRGEAGAVLAACNSAPSRCQFGGWQLDRHTRRLTDPGGTIVSLTKGEYARLIAFLNAPQRLLTREYLLQATRGHDDVVYRSVDVRILRLRRKRETDPSVPRVIRTERGVGYVFTARRAVLIGSPLVTTAQASGSD